MFSPGARRIEYYFHLCSMKLFQCCLIICVSITSLAQVPESFSGLRCAGEIPEDFTIAFHDKYERDLNSNLASGDLQRRDAREFAAITNYYNHNLLQGGGVLYGDPLSSYANKILDYLLEDEPDLRDEVRVYTIRSSHVNAYSTKDGIIFITLGLMAKIENEAQLAFVLAHEVGHYTKQHVLQSFSDQKEIWSNSGSYRGMDWEERSLTSFQHSREAEFEADDEGLEIFRNSAYQLDDIYSGFEVLLRGYLPIAEQPFDFERLQSDSFRITDRFFIDVVDEILAEEDIDDTKNTHPNVKKRKEAIRKSVGKQSDSTGRSFVVGNEAEFLRIRDLARFDMVNSFIRNANYLSALYHIQVLRETYPDHTFLRKAELMCWASIQMYINNRQKRDYSTGYRDLQGELQGLYYFGSKMSKKGINAIAVRFIWTHTDGLEEDEFVQALKAQCMRELPKGGYDRGDFRRTYPKPRTTSKKRRPKKYDFVKIAFVDLFQDSTFKQAYNDAFNQAEQDEFHEEFDDDEEEDVVADRSVEGVYSYYGLSGVDRLLFFNPRFFRVDFRKEQDQMFLRSDAQQTDLKERTEKLSGMAGVDLITVNDNQSDEFDTEAFNDFVTLNDWFREEVQFEGTGFTSFSTPALKKVREKYQTDYLGVNYVWHFTDRKEFSPLAAFVSALYVLPFPYYLYWQFKPDHQLNYTFAVFDLKKGDIGFYDSKVFSSKYRKDIINAHLFNSFNQLNR